MFDFVRKGVSKLNDILNSPLNETAYNLKWLELELSDWIDSKERKMQIKGFEYYNDKQAILDYKREAIGRDGKLEEVKNLPNKKIIDNQYKRLVNQKVNHLVGKPFTVDTDNKEYSEILNTYFNKKFFKLLKTVTKDTCIHTIVIMVI